ncbi:MAG: DNA polymerase III subunit gamma/tau [Anaerolineaceae bacterium]
MLYGKWRPKGFEEVVGQDHIVTTLRNALTEADAARKRGVAENDVPLAHAYLFSGPRGTGKTTTARILARAVNCDNLTAGEPCNECPSCVAISNGTAFDLIEMDAASNRGIDDIRELREKIGFAPSDLKKKVYLLDEVHMLTDGAFNALLKTLEEPPPHAIFILATTDVHKVLPTVKSRCQRYDFHRIDDQAMAARLRVVAAGEGFVLSDNAFRAIGRLSRGALRDAITLLEQVTAQCGDSPADDDVMAALGLVQDERTEHLARALVDEDLAAALSIARDIGDDGIDIARFTRETIDTLRHALAIVLRRGEGDGDPGSELAMSVIQSGGGPRALATAIAELARADFRLDPASPIPLEIACATAILGASLASVSAPVAASPGTGVAGPRITPGAKPSPRTIPSDTPLSDGEKFLKDLYERCRLVNVRLAGWLNGSCQVLSIGEDEFELGFPHPMHMEKVDTDCRTLVEEQAHIILGRAMRMKVRLVDQDSQAKRAPKAGHLAATAREIGGVPVGKDQ